MRLTSSPTRGSIQTLKRQLKENARRRAEMERQYLRLAKPRPKFAFYQRVLIAIPSARRREYFGEWGTIRGRARDRSGRWGYAVLLDISGECVDVMERELASNGEIIKAVPRTSVRVRVDAQGRGSLVR